MESQGDPEMEIDRSTTWILARHDKDGKMESEKLQTIALNIVSYSFLFQLKFLTYPSELPFKYFLFFLIQENMKEKKE